MKCPRCQSDNPDASRFCGSCAAPLEGEAPDAFSVTKTLVSPALGLARGAMVAGKYRILEEIGRGGMGIVYKAEDTKLGRAVALKFLPPQLTQDSEARDRFIHEARAASALDHPNICTIYEIGETEDGRMFIAMGFYEGESLREKIKNGPVEKKEALDIALQVAQGMEKAHSKGIVHRDIKPANILMTTEGVAKIVDFGLAKLAGQVRMTKEGTLIGTVAYMSPEQAKGEAVDQRTDIWSLGIVLYEMLTGMLPFKGDYDQSLIHSILSAEPGPMGKIGKGLPNGLEAIVFKALAKDPNSRYQSMGEMSEDLEAVAVGLKPTRAKLGLFRGKVFGIRKTRVLAGLGIVAAIVALVIALNPGGLRDRVLGRSSVSRPTSLAVLPIKDYSGIPEQEYFAEGMTEALIAGLGRIKAFNKVVSRTSVMQYKDPKKSLPQIAKELGVERIVEASIVRSGGRISITAMLRDAQDRQMGTPIKLEREMKDMPAVQSELVQAIAAEIKVQVTPQESERLRPAGQINPAAYEAYLRGKYFLSKWSEDGTKRALSYFQQSIDVDPTFASAYAGLADAFVWSHMMNLSPWIEAGPRARAAARRALDLDDGLAEAHAVMSTIMLNNWNWAEAERESQRAVALNPNSADAHFAHGAYLAFTGRTDEAVREDERRLELDPLTTTTNLQLGWGLYYAGRYDESITQLNKTLEMDMNLWAANMELSWNYAQKGMLTEAVAECRKALALEPDNPDLLGSCGRIFGLAGRRGEALSCLERLEGLSTRKNMGNPLSKAWLYDGLGETERSLECLEEAYRAGSPGLVGIRIETYSDKLRSDPRFQDLLRRMNFPE